MVAMSSSTVCVLAEAIPGTYYNKLAFNDFSFAGCTLDLANLLSEIFTGHVGSAGCPVFSRLSSQLSL
jgi:hypothetical protein